MATNYRSQARRELLHAMQAELKQECETLKAQAVDSSKPVGKRHEAMTKFWLKSAELATVNRKLKASARAKKSRSKSGSSILGMLGIR